MSEKVVKDFKMGKIVYGVSCVLPHFMLFIVSEQIPTL